MCIASPTMDVCIHVNLCVHAIRSRDTNKISTHSSKHCHIVPSAVKRWKYHVCMSISYIQLKVLYKEETEWWNNVRKIQIRYSDGCSQLYTESCYLLKNQVFVLSTLQHILPFSHSYLERSLVCKDGGFQWPHDRSHGCFTGWFPHPPAHRTTCRTRLSPHLTICLFPHNFLCMTNWLSRM